MDTAKLVFKVLSQEASEEEIATFNAWLSQSKDNFREFEHLQELWKGRNEEPKHNSDDRFYDGLKRIRKEICRREKKKRKIFIISFLTIIVCIVMLIHFLWG